MPGSHPLSVGAPAAALAHTTNFLVPEKPRSFSGTARVDDGVPKVSDVFLHRSQRSVQAKVLEESTRVVAFRVGPSDLVERRKPIAHQLRLTQFVHHRVFSLPGLFLSLFCHSHLPIGY
jgi:hypothetical protein